MNLFCNPKWQRAADVVFLWLGVAWLLGVCLLGALAALCGLCRLDRWCAGQLGEDNRD